jgi:sialate O-acetylesterase
MQSLVFNKLRILFITLFIIPASLKAMEWSCVVNLSGSWYFSVGDDPAWANPKTDVSDWDKIYVPGEWEEYYKGYNGYAWYRKNFDMHSYPENGRLSLLLGRIDDVDEVFINGIKVGQTGSFFPDYHTAYDVDRKYNLPEGLLKPTGNVIAVRVYDEGNPGGIVSGDDIGVYYDNDNSLLNLDLSGDWKFSVYREPNVTEKSYDDDNWKTIKVPSSWESQGFSNHDGYGWYRKVFTIPQNLKQEDLYLSLGKIDDYDKVYFNGKLIGRTEDLEFYNRFNRSNAWRMYRIYRIPERLIETTNVVVVEVYDYQQQGGIYDGPVGITTHKNANILEERNEDENWPFSVQSIFHSFFNW